MMKRLIFLGGVCGLLTGCGNPRSALDKIIEGMNFIPFEQPMSSFRVGTMLRGNNDVMALVATPEQCFPDLPANHELRVLEQTDLPSEASNFSIGINAGLSAIFMAGSPLLSFQVGYAKSVSVSFQGADIELLDESSFKDYYKSGMSLECKQLLAQNPFIGKALRVDGMSFQFTDSTGAAINLGAIPLGSVVTISPGVNFHIDSQYSLVITSPKYIGYQMTKYTQATDDLMYAATTDRNGEWLFQDLTSTWTPTAAVASVTAQSKRVAEPLR
jgi:hypothetical protein